MGAARKLAGEDGSGRYQARYGRRSEAATPSPLRFEELVDVAALQELTDELYRATSIPSAIITTEGDVLTGSGWQRVCTEFHRQNEECLRDCIASDTRIHARLDAGEPFVIYTCPRGLVDASSRVTIEGQHVANVFAGQLFMKPLTDQRREAFREQARRFGFDEEAYMRAVEAVPVLPEERFRPALSFLARFARLVASIGLARLHELAALAELKASERKYRRLLEATRTVPFELDLQSEEFTYIGPQAERIFGYPIAHWQKLDSWAATLHPEDREAAVAFCRQQTLVGEDHDLHYRAIRADGTVIWIHDVVSVLRDERGGDRLVGFMLDVTAAKHAEEDRKALESRLRQVHKHEAVGRLAGGIAHDFNNLLGAILGYTELSQLQVAPASEIAEYLDQVLAAAERAKALVGQILTFSRKGEEEHRIVDLLAISREAIQLLRSTIPSTIEIRELADTPAATILGDPTQIHQVIVNLATNAYHAMRQQGGVLTVSIAEVEVDQPLAARIEGLRPGSFVRLALQDSGVGMGEAVIRRIFDPYFTTKTLGEGTGLGLSVVHGIVNNHGGAIEVASRPGEGSTFTVYLPRFQESEGMPPPPPMELPGGSERILFVDDEPTLSRLGGSILTGLGYTVTEATGSGEAYQRLRRSPADYDLVISDQTMPGMTGIELARALHRIRPDLPVILCTGFSDLVDEDSARAQGIAQLLYKPLRRADLAVAVRAALDRRQAPAPPDGDSR